MSWCVRRGEGWSIAACVLVIGSVAAAEPQWNILKPSTTGIPGEEVRVLNFDPEGNLWVAGRWIFWEECGLAMLPAAELPYTPLPGGGFDTGAWEVWSNVNHPIPSVYIHDIEFGPGGVMWIASDGGLTRFDRNATAPQDMWFTYNAANSPLIMDAVRSLDLDSQGNLWLTNVSPAFSNGALFKFNPVTNQWTQYMVGQQLPWSPPWYNVNAVHVGSSGKVYVTHSVLGGMAEFDGTSWVLRNCPYALGQILEDLQGNVWITSAEAGLWKWNGTSFQTFDLGSQGTVTALGMDPVTGLVYAGAWYGNIYKVINGTVPQFFVNADDIPGSIWPRPDGDIWINNYGGNGVLGRVRHYDAQGALLERFNSFNSGLPDYFIDRIETDRSGNIWFASGEGGLSRFDGERWRNWGNHNDGSEPYPWAGNEPMDAMCHDTEGNIWMAGNGVGRWNPAIGSFSGFWNWQNSNFGSMISVGVTQDGSGTMWVGEAYVGAWHFDPEMDDWVLHTWAPPGWTANDVRDVATDSSGTLWVLTYIALHRRNANGTWSTWDSTNSPLTLGGLFDIEPARPGGIWVGISGKLLHFDGTAWTTVTQEEAGWPGENVTGIAVRAGDGLLAVTSQQPETYPYTGGLSVFDDAAWTHWTPQNSPLTHWQCSAPQFDAEGHLWVSTMSEGVVQVLIGTPAPGDLDGDGDVDVEDWTLFAECMTGPDGDIHAGCEPADVSTDGDVDLDDFAEWQALVE